MRNKTSKSSSSFLLGLAGGVVVIISILTILAVNPKSLQDLPKDDASNEEIGQAEIRLPQETNLTEKGTSVLFWPFFVRPIPRKPEWGNQQIYDLLNPKFINIDDVGKWDFPTPGFHVHIRENGDVIVRLENPPHKIIKNPFLLILIHRIF